VRGVRFIRTRRTGARYWIDIEVTVANDLDVTRIDELAARIRGTLEQHLLCHHVEIFAFPEVAPEHPHLAGSSAQ
jgi:divalent metal cation (Fe/Co/Zn/Cd) transporter